MKYSKIIITLSLIGIVGIGCTNDVRLYGLSYQEKKQVQLCKSHTPASKRIKKEGTVLGCMASLAISKVFGYKDSAALMCAAGGMAGYLIGDSLAERRCEYVSLERQLDGEIEHLTQTNNKFKLLLVEQEMNLKNVNDQTSMLLEQNKQGTMDKEKLDEVATKVVVRLGKERYLLDHMEQEQAFKKNTLMQAMAKSSDSNKVAALTHAVSLLGGNMNQLQNNNDSLYKTHDALNTLCKCKKKRKDL